MPKSRGRRQPSSKSNGRSQPLSFEARAIDYCKRLFAEDATRLQAEVMASHFLGETTAEELIAQADKRRTPQAAALVAALQTVIDVEQPDWVGEHVKELTWPQQPTPQPKAARRLRDVYDDEVIWLVEYEDCTLAVTTARWFEQGVIRIMVLDPGPIDGLEEGIEPVGLAQAITAARRGLEQAQKAPIDSEDFYEGAHLLAARLHVVELPDAAAALPVPVAIPDEFPALFLAFGAQLLDGDPFAWSPAIVERFLFDWLPTQEIPENILETTRAWVQYALTERGLKDEDVQVCAEVVTQLTEAFNEENPS